MRGQAFHDGCQRGAISVGKDRANSCDITLGLTARIDDDEDPGPLLIQSTKRLEVGR